MANAYFCVKKNGQIVNTIVYIIVYSGGEKLTSIKIAVCAKQSWAEKWPNVFTGEENEFNSAEIY